MQTTGIEWTRNRAGKKGYVWNCAHGCRHGCPWCYARRFAKRLAGRGSYPKEDPFQPILDYDELNCKWPKKPSRIFVASMGDLFGDWGWRPHSKEEGFFPDELKLAPDYVASLVMERICKHAEHTCLILTKAPDGILRYEAKRGFVSSIPSNVWLGVSVDNRAGIGRLMKLLLVRHPNKFVSFEPLLEDVTLDPWFSLVDIKWVIIGAQTGPGAKPVDQAAVTKLVSLCRLAGIPVFVKDNVGWANPPQEFPEGFP